MVFRAVNEAKLRKYIARTEFAFFRNIVDTGRSTTRKKQFIILLFIEKVPFVSTYVKVRWSKASPFKARSSLFLSNLEVPEIISLP